MLDKSYIATPIWSTKNKACIVWTETDEVDQCEESKRYIRTWPKNNPALRCARLRVQEGN